MSDKKELTGTCEACCFEGAHTQIYKATSEETKGIEQKLFEHCDICYSTFAGNASRYPNQYPHVDVMVLMAYIGNLILSKLEAKK